MKKSRIGALLAAAGLVLAFAGTTLAATGEWQGNGYPSSSCQADTTGTMLWIWTGDDPTSLTINGHTYTGWDQQGKGAWHLTLDITADNYPPETASVEYTGDAGTLTLSGCNETTTTTTTTAETTTSTTTAETTTSTTTAETTDSSTTDETTDSSTTAETTESTTSSGTGGVEAETATPEVTPPSTDTLASSSQTPSGGSWSLLLVVMAGVLAGALLLAPAKARTRR